MGIMALQNHEFLFISLSKTISYQRWLVVSSEMGFIGAYLLSHEPYFFGPVLPVIRKFKGELKQ